MLRWTMALLSLVSHSCIALLLLYDPILYLKRNGSLGYLILLDDMMMEIVVSARFCGLG